MYIYRYMSLPNFMSPPLHVLTQQAATSEALVSKIPWFPVQSKAHVYQATFSSDGQKAGMRPVFVTIFVLQN